MAGRAMAFFSFFGFLLLLEPESKILGVYVFGM
jgi:hypothetical protein